MNKFSSYCFLRSGQLVQAALLLMMLMLAGCATPIGVWEVSTQAVYRDMMASPLTEGVTSNGTNIVLQRFDLVDSYDHHPARVISQLHEQALHDGRRDILYALAELSYLHGERLERESDSDEQYLAPNYFLLASIYAYLFLVDDRDESSDRAFDIRTRTACDLYNFALWRGMATGGDGSIILKGGLRRLRVGRLDIRLDLAKFPFDLKSFSAFEPADRYKIRGISIRNRTKGVGSALIGMKRPSRESPFPTAVPISIFLELHGGLTQLTEGTATGTLKVFSAYEENVLEIKGRKVPLETDTTTPMAYGLEGSQIWDFGIGAFLGREFHNIPNGLYLSQPYQPGRIPVVFVHGTFSNPAWWAEMFNTLKADPILRQRYQFWYFLYNSSAPVLISAADLRDALRAKLAALDPDQRDPALQQIVVVGHSQGGLLTKLTAVDSGDSLVQSLTGKDFAELNLPAGKQAEARRILLVEPVPGVRRVIFISTPHRGSILSKNWIRSLVRRVVTLPVTIIATTLTFTDYLNEDARRVLGSGKVPTSIDGMSPDNPVLQTLAVMPLVPGITGHSIIAVKGEGDLQQADDGVVAYTSAHLDGMESEFIVHSGHSCQGHPFTIEEVRRILLVHLQPE